MKITAVAVGTRGDVNPLVDLGAEMMRRGHDFRILTQEGFRPLVEGKGVKFLHLDGDADHILKYLVTDYKTNVDFFVGLLRLKRENPAFMEQTMEALTGSDVCMYGTCSGFVRDAADKLGIPCIRYFYSPYDRTDLYSLYSLEHGTPAVAKSYDNITGGMPMLSNLLMGKWRRKNHIPKVKNFEHYTMQNGRKVLTFYPVSPIFMPKDPKWGSHIHVTGYWYHPEQDAEGYEMPADLAQFLSVGEKPVFVAFGKAELKMLAELQLRTLEALRESNIRAVVQAFQLPASEKVNTDRLYFIDQIPYSYIFPRVRGVVHHGGCTTNGIGIWAGCPALIIPLALDQWYYGRCVYELGIGPEPLYIRKKLCSKAEIKRALEELVSGKYDMRAKELSQIIRKENGISEAICAIEEYVQRVHDTAQDCTH